LGEEIKREGRELERWRKKKEKEKARVMEFNF